MRLVTILNLIWKLINNKEIFGATQEMIAELIQKYKLKLNN